MSARTRLTVRVAAFALAGSLVATPCAALNIVYTPLSMNNNPNISGFVADINAFDIYSSLLLATSVATRRPLFPSRRRQC